MFAKLQASFIRVDALRFGMSVTPSVQGNLASFLVRVSFVRFLDGDVTGHGRGGFSLLGPVGRSHRGAPRWRESSDRASRVSS